MDQVLRDGEAITAVLLFIAALGFGLWGLYAVVRAAVLSALREHAKEDLAPATEGEAMATEPASPLRSDPINPRGSGT